MGRRTGDRLATSSTAVSAAAQPAAVYFCSVSISAQPLLTPHKRSAGETSTSGRSSRNAVYELARVTSPGTRDKPTLGSLALRRPVAALHLLPEPLVLFLAGAIAGAIGKTLTAPLDRVKILLQVRGGLAGEAVREAAAGGNVVKAFLAIGKYEGVGGYWKGNLPQVMRVLPYSAAQLYSYEVFKRVFRNEDGGLSVGRRMAAGACAGMTSTLLTYPLDTLRFRLAVDPSLVGVRAAARALFREGAYPAFFRGLGTALIGIAPYMALELASYDLLPRDLPPFVRGFSAALIATTVCYPLDTVRRQIQLASGAHVSLPTMLSRTLEAEGVRGLYRGWIPNALKNLPNKGVRLSTFEAAKTLLVASEVAYEEEVEQEHRQLQPLHPS